MIKLTNITLESLPGAIIDNVCQKAILLAVENDCPVIFRFNDKILIAYKNSKVSDLLIKYWENNENTTQKPLI